MTIETDILEMKTDISYIKSMIEEISMSNGRGGEDNREAVKAQFDILNKMFSKIPGLNPEIKNNIDKIFQRAGGGL